MIQDLHSLLVMLLMNLKPYDELSMVVQTVLKQLPPI